MDRRSHAAMLAPVLWITVAVAQGGTIGSQDLMIVTEQSPGPNVDPDSVFELVDQMPQFSGGQDEMFKFLAGNLMYPDEAVDAEISGVVYVAFVVEKDGSIGESRVLRGIGGGCDEEAIRVVRSMPKWKPGIHGGKPARVEHTLPVRYALTTKSRKK